MSDQIQVGGILLRKSEKTRKEIALDFGFGSGVVTKELLRIGYKVVGYDIDKAIGEKIHKSLSEEFKNNFSYYYGLIDNYPFNNIIFDLIVCREVLEHIQDKKNILNLFYRILKDDGKLIISIPTEKSEKLFSFFDKKWLKKCQHIDIINMNNLNKLLRETSYQIDNMTGEGFRWFIFWLLLSPFRVQHNMGNPIHNSLFVRFAFKISLYLNSVKRISNFGNKYFPKSHVFYLSKLKPSILCVYDYKNWILGTWAKNIEKIYSNKYNIFLLSMFDAKKDISFTKKLVETVDVVYLLLPHAFNYFYSLKPKKIICAVHHWVNYSDFYHIPIEKSDYIVTGAEEWKRKIIEKNNNAKVYVTHSGFDDLFISNIRPKKFDCSRIFVIGFFSKYSSNEYDRKGTRHLRKLMEVIAKNNSTSNYIFLITGSGWDNFIEETSNLGIEIIYNEHVSPEEMSTMYNMIDVYLMLSDVEGGPATIAESMVSGCITITTKAGLSKDVIINKKNGFFIETSDINSIFQLLEYLRKNNDVCSEISTNAINYALEKLAYKETFKPLNNLFRTAIKTKTEINQPLMNIKNKIIYLESIFK